MNAIKIVKNVELAVRRHAKEHTALIRASRGSHSVQVSVDTLNQVVRITRTLAVNTVEVVQNAVGLCAGHRHHQNRAKSQYYAGCIPAILFHFLDLKRNELSAAYWRDGRLLLGWATWWGDLRLTE